MAQEATTSIYLISQASVEESFFRDLDAVLATGKVAAFQLRLKDIERKELLDKARETAFICHKHGVQFIVNDHPDIALEVGADGVHIGEEDISPKEARKILGKDKIIGVSCYNSTDRAIDMAESGADYVAFGAFFPTQTKVIKYWAKPHLIQWWVRNSVIPCVAIGGINSSNCQDIASEKPDFIAVVSAVWAHKNGPVAGVEELFAAINKASTAKIA